MRKLTFTGLATRPKPLDTVRLDLSNATAETIAVWREVLKSAAVVE